MSDARRRLLAALVPGAVLAAWAAGGLLILVATLDAPRLAALAPLAASHGALLFGWWLVGAALGAWAAFRLYVRHVAEPARLADAARLLAGNPAAPELPLPAGGAARRLAEAINRLAAERRGLEADMARMVAEASGKVAQQRDQLGALMAELDESVVVCNPEGRILLYNERARALCRRLSQAPASAGGAELIGLGRSIFAVIDPARIAHAREVVERRIARGAATPSARFVTTTPAGHLLQVSLAPVRTAGAAAASGFVLLLDDITESYAASSRQSRRLVELTEAGRASLAGIQAALDMLDYPDLEPAERDRFHEVVRAELAALTARLGALDADAALDRLARWPLQEMLGADLATAAAQRITAVTGRAVDTTEAAGEATGEVWLRVDSFALIEALACLAARLVAVVPDAALSLRLVPDGAWAHLDLAWTGAAGGDRLAGWQGEAIRLGEAGVSLTIRDIAERHGGELWLGRDAAAASSFFRFLLPVAAAEETGASLPARPEFYDFDLFALSDASRALEDCPLDALACTIFDTETTGLDPAGGDEILQIGAVRVVNGRILASERFDQLVDPRRSIPEASIPFHGITPDMVRGQPALAEVLPAFAAFAADTVLVGHNVAFDLRFFELKAAATGVAFTQPVLDTLLLASVAQPHEPSQSMEAIAARLGVEVTGRHSALGDALTTAEIFVRLLPALRQRDILTLGQARQACETSLYARLRY